MDDDIKKVDAVAAPPELDLDVEDDKLIKFIEAYNQTSDTFEKDIKLQERRDTNKRFYFGKQISEGIYNGIGSALKIRSYETPIVDNVLKEGADKLRPLVLSRLPEFIIKAGNSENEDSQKSAEGVTKMVNNALTSQELKLKLDTAFKHHNLNFIGILKWRWNPQKGKLGDFDVEVIHPKNIRVDHTATSANECDMKVITHYVEKSLKEWILLFPSKEEILIEEARKIDKFQGDPDEKAMATRLKLEEVWFDWFDKKAVEEGQEVDKDNPEYEYKSGVLWKTKDAILDKRLNPNWDWEGTEEVFYNGQPVPEDLLAQIQAMGLQLDGLERKKVYKNFFGKPRKPFIFISYEQWGEMPYDETTFIEENLYLQQDYDKRKMQTTKMLDDARGKHVFSSMGGLKKKTIEEMDLNDPDEDIFTDGDVRSVHSFITKEQPSAQMLNDIGNSKDRILTKMHVSGSVGGEIESDTATTNQIQRESSFMVADDISDLMILPVCTQLAEALVHVMKLRYKIEHFEKVLGQDAENTFLRTKQDIIEDGMEIEVFASGTDKLKAERQAKEEAGLGLIDPLSYYKDTGRADPEGRAEKLFLFQTQPELYFKKFVEGEDLPDIAEQVMLMSQQKLQAAQGQAAQGMPMPQGAPMQPSAGNTSNIPTTPQGSPRGLVGKAMGAVGGLFGGK